MHCSAYRNSIVATLLLESGQWQSIITADPLEWLYLAFVAAIGFYLAYVAWFTLLQRVRVDEAAAFVLLMTPIGVATAVIWLGKTLHWAQVAGGAVLLLGLAVVSGVVGRRVREACFLPLRLCGLALVHQFLQRSIIFR